MLVIHTHNPNLDPKLPSVEYLVLPMSAHVSQAVSIAHCTDSEDLPCLYFRQWGQHTDAETHCTSYL